MATLYVLWQPEARDMVVVFPQVSLPFRLEDAKAREGVILTDSNPRIESKDNKKEWSSVHIRSGRVVKPPVLYMTEYGSDGVEGALSAMHQNYYPQLCLLGDKEAKNI